MKEMLAIILIFFAPCLLSENHKKLFKYLVDADETDPGFVPTLDSKFLVRYHNKVRREIGSSNMMEVVSRYYSSQSNQSSTAQLVG